MPSSRRQAIGRNNAHDADGDGEKSDNQSSDSHID
jgi:hypothetical protein